MYMRFYSISMLLAGIYVYIFFIQYLFFYSIRGRVPRGLYLFKGSTSLRAYCIDDFLTQLF